MATTYKPKRHIVVDIESLSTDRNAAIIDLGATVVDFNGGQVSQFQTYIRSAEQQDCGKFDIDPGTVDWHTKQDPGFIDLCESAGVSFQEAATNFAAWIAAQSDYVELHFWSQGKDFDFPILENLFKAAGVQVPWTYSRVHCLRDLVWLNPAARLKEKNPNPHKALSDAVHEANQLIAVYNNSSWYQRLFK